MELFLLRSREDVCGVLQLTAYDIVDRFASLGHALRMLYMNRILLQLRTIQSQLPTPMQRIPPKLVRGIETPFRPRQPLLLS